MRNAAAPLSAGSGTMRRAGVYTTAKTNKGLSSSSADDVHCCIGECFDCSTVNRTKIFVRISSNDDDLIITKSNHQNIARMQHQRDSSHVVMGDIKSRRRRSSALRIRLTGVYGLLAVATLWLSCTWSGADAFPAAATSALSNPSWSSSAAPSFKKAFVRSKSFYYYYSTTTTTQLAARGSSSSSSSDNENEKKNGHKDRRQPRRRQAARARAHNITDANGTASINGASSSGGGSSSLDMLQRITQLEEMVSKQAVEIKRLKDECKSLTEAMDTFASVVELLREAGLTMDDEDDVNDGVENSNDGEQKRRAKKKAVESLHDDDIIFGKAPSSVMDAADSAGAAVLAGLLAGQRRLLVDVRDAELSTSNAETLVQFIELAVLPVAAGLEGLRSKRNRLKIVFPKVSQLLEYRKTMALAAPEVVALSTLDFDPVETQDNLVVILAPRPDDTEGIEAMNALLDPKGGITQPVVVLNPYMAPVTGPAANFEVAYQLRLFTVHYMAKPPPGVQNDEAAATEDGEDEKTKKEDQLEAAMQHAKEVSRNPTEHGGTTRAMVIRAYPNPWNVFVDTSPDTDSDFVVAATFAEEPSPDDVNMAIIECLEGSEEEDELVAQQMQQALESGQLDRVSELLGSMGLDFSDEDDEDEDDDDEDDLWKLQDVDTV